jgi:UrcA family protein
MDTVTHPASASSVKAVLCLAAVLAMYALASAPALAGPPTESAPVTRSATTSLNGLDLSTPGGVSAARERLRQIARRLCSRVADELDLSHQSNFTACVDESVAAALLAATRGSAPPAMAARALEKHD